MKIKVLDDTGFVELVSVQGDEELISRVAGISHESEKGPGVAKLLEWGHMSPFEFASMTFRIKCPIFVARQLFRHRTGHYMEKSLRYCEGKPEFYVPKTQQAVEYKEQYQNAWEMYKTLVAWKEPKEQARCVLPMGMYTEYYFQMDMRNLISLLKLRLDEHAQMETQEYARAILRFLDAHFPVISDYIIKSVDNDK
jgi:Predicted alternative thymidylate synthase